MNADEVNSLIAKSQTKTAKDAMDRMDLARLGSLRGVPSREYLSTLLSEVQDWARAIREELYRIHKVKA